MEYAHETAAWSAIDAAMASRAAEGWELVSVAVHPFVTEEAP